MMDDTEIRCNNNCENHVLDLQKRQPYDVTSGKGIHQAPTSKSKGTSLLSNNTKNKKLFPQKLWNLINDDKYNFCLRWSDDGQLVYLNRDKFENSYLKTAENQFHTQKAISFVRQMNMYGFKKVDDCYYENDNFKRNCDHLLKNMVRKHPSKNQNHQAIKPIVAEDSTHSANTIDNLEGRLNQLKSFYVATALFNIFQSNLLCEM